MVLINEETNVYSTKQRIASHALREKKKIGDKIGTQTQKNTNKKERNWVEKLEDFMGVLKKAAQSLKEHLNLNEEFVNNVREVSLTTNFIETQELIDFFPSHWRMETSSKADRCEVF